MQSVGIMSMQRIFNYGSSLQAYALRRLVQDTRPDAAVTFVDYRPEATLIPAETSRGPFARATAKIREYSAVDASLRNKLAFFNHKRTYAKKYFPLVGIRPVLNRDLDLDVQIIGSDEVFNCVQANTNVGFARDLFGHASPARRVVSYAASFGNTTLAKIDAAGVRAKLREDLLTFDAISVRDRNSARIVHDLTERDAELNLDPTLVYDFAQERRSLIPAARQRNEKYVVVYGYSGRFSNEENAAVRRYARSLGARVLAFGGLQASADEFIDCDPFTLLAYFRDAEAVITDTFHGTIFSIINETPFATIIRPSSGHGYGNEEKLGYLLETLDLADRICRPGVDLVAMFDQPMSFDGVRAIRERESQRTRAYLAAALR